MSKTQSETLTKLRGVLENIAEGVLVEDATEAIGGPDGLLKYYLDRSLAFTCAYYLARNAGSIARTDVSELGDELREKIAKYYSETVAAMWVRFRKFEQGEMI